jgi:hypothetical protein
MVLLHTVSDVCNGMVVRFDDILCNAREQRAAEGFRLKSIEIVRPKRTPSKADLHPLRLVVSRLRYNETATSNM